MKKEIQNRKALILGVTGLVGSECLEVLLTSGYYQKIIEAGRNASGKKAPSLFFEKIDFESEDSLRASLKADDIYCCLGTTHAKAGSKEAFRKVDYEYVAKAAKAAFQNGASRFLLVSSAGADPLSKIYYSKVKGDIEMFISGMGFECVHIFRPSVLVGERKEKRTGEGLMQWFSRNFAFLFTGPLKAYKPNTAKSVARAMLFAAQENKKGIFIYSSPDIQYMSRDEG